MSDVVDRAFGRTSQHDPRFRPKSARYPARSKIANIAAWVLQLTLAAVFLVSASAKVMAVPRILTAFELIGFGEWFRYFTAGVEIVGAAALLLPRATAHGAIAMAATMAGAIAALLLAIHESVISAVALMLLCLLLAWLRRDQLYDAVVMITRGPDRERTSIVPISPLRTGTSRNGKGHRKPDR